MSAALILLRRFWYVIPLIGLAFTVLWLRGSLADAKSDARAAEARASELSSANKTLSSTIDMVTRERADNDAIAEAVAAKLEANRDSETGTRTIIERTVQNDPATRDWAAVPVPGGVREALRTGKVNASAP